MTGTIHLADSLEVLRRLPEASVDLIYVDPPFNTGKVQKRTRIKTVRSTEGNRVGFQGRRYESTELGTMGFDDRFDDPESAFLDRRLVGRRVELAEIEFRSTSTREPFRKMIASSPLAR